MPAMVPDIHEQDRDGAVSAPPVPVVLSDRQVPPGVSELEASGAACLRVHPAGQGSDDLPLVRDCPGLVLAVRGDDLEVRKRLGRWVAAVSEQNLQCIILADDPKLRYDGWWTTADVLPKIQWCGWDVGAEELRGRIAAMLDYRQVFDRSEKYLGQLEQWASSLNNSFEELHQELRLAWRVQQDFLPKQLPNGDRARFAALYRPASWVSGDIYDVFRLDEHHVGFYVADVVGHGVAAGLMTLFVKRALVTKEIGENSYVLVPPGRSLSKLNADLSEMQLPEQQFVTACYAVLNTKTFELSVARGGHPLPILIDSSGQVSRIEVPGPLLGVFEDSEYPDVRVQLAAGDKLVMITDGLEQAFGHDEHTERKVVEALAKLHHLGAEELVQAFHGVLDSLESSLHTGDDITVVVAEALPKS